MAEEAMTATRKLNGDTPEVNGLGNDDVSDGATKVQDTKDAVSANISKLAQETSSSKDAMQIDPEPTENAKGRRRKQSFGKATVVVPKSPRGIKRRADSSLSAKSDDEEEFTAFVDTGDIDKHKRLSEILDKMESQLQRPGADGPTPVKIRRKDTSPIGNRITTPMADNSRPSSGLSQISEDLLAGGRSSSIEVTSSTTNSPVPGRGGRKSVVDLSNPLFRVPMEHGWKRELVYRAALDPHSRRTGDIYYYAPSGKKLRSSREVGEHLGGTGLTLDNFSFFKEALGLDDPEKEIIRDAKMQKGSPLSVSTPTWSPVAGNATPRVEGKRTPKPKVPKGASPDRGLASPKPKQAKLQVQALLGTAKNLHSIPKVDAPVKGKPAKKPAVITKISGSPRSSLEDTLKTEKDSDSGSFTEKSKRKSNTPQGRDTPKRRTDTSKDKTEPTSRDSRTRDKSGFSHGTPKGNETPRSKADAKKAKDETPKGKTDAKSKSDTPKAKAVESKKKSDSVKSKENSKVNKNKKSQKSKNDTASKENQDGEDHFTKFYTISEQKGYKSVERIFQYLKMRELAAASRVCALWHRLVNQPSLWKHVRMKNSQVNSWKSLCAILKRHGTVVLDLRKMLLPQNGGQDDTFWKEFCEHIAQVDTLIRLELCRCPAWVVESVSQTPLRLRVFNALSLQCEKLDPAHLHRLTELEELRLKSQSGFFLTSDLQPLAALTKLKHLSLTSIKDLGSSQCDVISTLSQLESVELGECSLLPVDFGQVLSKLPFLKRLRLERGASTGDPESGVRLLRALSTIPTLMQLELVNFDVKTDFDVALAECTNLRRLLLIPTYVSQSATTNKQVLSGLLQLKDTLTHLMWGVTIELLKVTELFVDQCEQNKDKKNKQNQGECIPVLKPVPGFESIKNADGSLDGTTPVQGPPQVEILPLPLLQTLLTKSLPNTKLKVLRIPFHATWRQTLADFQ